MSPSSGGTDDFKLPLLKFSLLNHKNLYHTIFPRKYHFYNPFCYSNIIPRSRNQSSQGHLGRPGTRNKENFDALVPEGKHDYSFFGNDYIRLHDMPLGFLDEGDFFRDIKRFINDFSGFYDSSFWNHDELPSSSAFDRSIIKQDPGSYNSLSQTTSDPGFYKLEIHLPDVNKENVKISITNNTLEVSASSRREEVPVSDGNNHMARRLENKYYQSVHLPQNLDLRRAKASFINGSLVIKIPKHNF